MKYLKTYEDSKSIFNEGDWVVAEYISSWYESSYPKQLEFLRTAVGQISTVFDLGGYSYNVAYFNTDTDDDFFHGYYNNNPAAYQNYDEEKYKIYHLGDRELRSATQEEIEKEKEKIAIENNIDRYNL